MRFQLVSKSSTLDDLNLCKFKLSGNFALAGMFGRQQRLNRMSARELLRTESTFQQCIDYVDIAGRS